MAVVADQLTRDLYGAGASVTIPRVDENVLSDEELSTLSDAQLVALIEERSNLKGAAASEALTILRGDVPDDEDF